MEPEIYFFTGTGNSLVVAKMLAQRMGGRLTPIASAVRREAVRSDSPVVGLVFPLYGLGLPLIVERFAGLLQTRDDAYVFAVATRGLKVSGGALPQLDEVFKNHGRRLDAGFYVTMVDNYLYKFTMPTPEKARHFNVEAEDCVDRIYDSVQRRVRRVEPALLDVFASVYYPRFIRRSPSMDDAFSATTACTRCGFCERVCPVDNVRLEDEGPAWLHGCQQCLACVHLCPTQAIQIKGVPPERGRYINPGVTPDEVASQRNT